MWSGLLVVFLLGSGHRRGYLRMACKLARLHKNLYKESYVFCPGFGSNFRRRSLPEIVAKAFCEVWVLLSLVLLVLLCLLNCLFFLLFLLQGRVFRFGRVCSCCCWYCCCCCCCRWLVSVAVFGGVRFVVAVAVLAAVI